ncbi:MAG TPA: ribosome small subunit-dependent GTPase A, partial [Legionella sp.]|nr:ribosome small subunit-dependent GTPase A [Legionella sp.]
QYHSALDYSLILTGHDQKQGYEDLQRALNHNTSVFVGQSGVGKSSLIAQMLPNEPSIIHVAAISEKSELGCHTTSNSCFYHLPSGGALIDSPGVREFGLWHMPASDIANGYREFRPFLSNCKFRNCNHRDAPGCALLQAVKNKQISHKRYENYVKINTPFAT